MLYLFFLSSLVTSFLFVSPKHFHAPLQKGVSLLFLLLCFYSFWKQKKESESYASNQNVNLWYKQNHFLPYFVAISGMCFVLASSYHAYHLTQFFADSFLFHDADYIGISDVLLSITKGIGFQSHYYSATVNGSYLNHHFSPGMVFLSPFVQWIPNRYGLAVGVFFFYQLTTILWLLWAYKVLQKNKPELHFKFLVVWVVLTNQMYLYRIGSSYHFEILVVFIGFFFFYQWERCKTIRFENQKLAINHLFLLGLALLLFLFQKEDIGIYLCLFFFPLFLYSLFGVIRLHSFKGIFDTRKNRETSLLFGILFTIICYLSFVFLIFPILNGSDSIFGWTHALRQGYHSSFKQVTTVSKSIQIFLELLLSMGMGIIQLIPELIGMSLIYLTHVISTRPWHHEVYSYYSYSLLPFLLYVGIQWLKSKKQISLPFVYLILACLFWKNSMDQNFPIDSQSDQNWYHPIVLSEVSDDLPKANNILESGLESFANIQTKERIVFSQYNLSFRISDKVTVYPLEQLANENKICKIMNLCYVVMAPELTDTTLWPKKRILDTFAETNPMDHQKIWQGKQIEIWKLTK